MYDFLPLCAASYAFASDGPLTRRFSASNEREHAFTKSLNQQNIAMFVNGDCETAQNRMRTGFPMFVRKIMKRSKEERNGAGANEKSQAN